MYYRQRNLSKNEDNTGLVAVFFCGFVNWHVIRVVRKQ